MIGYDAGGWGHGGRLARGGDLVARVAVSVDGQRLDLTNLGKVLYPAAEFTKRDVIDYYRQVAPHMLLHLADRAATLRRFPDGVDAASFYEKNVARHAPRWVRTARLGSMRHEGSDPNDYPIVADLPTLVWVANLAALEIHVPQWTVTSGNGRSTPDRLVFDLDPGPPATVVECCRVAERLREILHDDGLDAFAKSSGSKGMQVYSAVRTERAEDTSTYAKAVARQLARESPGEVTATMTKSLRTGKVFIDWSQNNPAKTTVAPYSLRAREQPTVSTPVTWDEVEACAAPADLTFTAADVLTRIDDHGDLFAGLLAGGVALPQM
ncbi:MAG: ATP-dependent DNA ligase [Actinophytocola sp.]|nr:ATP-dependent DNA ligase [Actinophytocola sp.]